jgi:GNAT superfamily N-acetyltransferase
VGSLTFRLYDVSDHQACIDLFDANCPDYFAQNERADFEAFLNQLVAGYEVCELDGRVVGAFGLFGETGERSLNWLILKPTAQGTGLGSTIMERVIHAGRADGAKSIAVAASHTSAPFFARFGATQTGYTPDGWGPGMHRVDMEIVL